MKAVIANFRMSRHRQYDNQMVIRVDSVDSKEKASKLVGKQVVWKTSGDKEIKGRVSSAHGNSGAVRVLFETGMPGQAVGAQVSIK
ncbi:50S ribosomal protein L35ae [Candidatus Woesearchaeota archaeon]|nr:50S ribosomal protein L35ae [Candidatus Woesearchaeota archaeon]